MISYTVLERRKENRVQHLVISVAGELVRACRYRITEVRWCPWLIAMGADKLPENAIKRGQVLTSLFNA